MIRDWLFGDARDSCDQRCRTLVERCGYGAAALTILPIPGSEVIGVMPLHVGPRRGVIDRGRVASARTNDTCDASRSGVPAPERGLHLLVGDTYSGGA